MKLNHAAGGFAAVITLLSVIVTGAFAVAAWVLFNVVGGFAQWYGWAVFALALLLSVRTVWALIVGAVSTVLALAAGK